MPCAISRIAGNYRNQVVMTAATAAPLQRVLAAVRDKGGLTRGEKVAVEWTRCRCCNHCGAGVQPALFLFLKEAG
jgi:hypothetical protein